MLLLDEMLPHAVAEELCRRGFDTNAVVARPDLRGCSDADVLEAATRKGRILVTDNVSDFVQLSNAWLGQERRHPGIVLISSKAFPMTRGRAGLVAAALLARCRAADWPAPGQYDFLRRQPPGG